jgi:hypothetical protein
VVPTVVRDNPNLFFLFVTEALHHYREKDAEDLNNLVDIIRDNAAG